jgi:hypothetical protein
MSSIKFLEKGAGEITYEFQKFINDEVKKCWIGKGYPGSSKPLSSYEESYLRISGEIPLLITTPHAVPHDRGHVRLKEQDNNTDFLATELCKNLNCYGLIPLKPLADPNKLSKPLRKIDPPVWKDTKEVSFFLEAERVIKDRTIEFLLDIHGMVDSYEDSAVIGTAGVKTKYIWTEELKEYFDKCGIRTAINFTQSVNGKRSNFSGGDFVRNISIPGLQLEIKRAYRTCEQMHKLSRFLANFLQGKFDKLSPSR